MSVTKTILKINTDTDSSQMKSKYLIYMQGQRCEYLIYFTCTVGDQWATFEVEFSDLNSSITMQ